MQPQVSLKMAIFFAAFLVVLSGCTQTNNGDLEKYKNDNTNLSEQLSIATTKLDQMTHQIIELQTSCDSNIQKASENFSQSFNKYNLGINHLLIADSYDEFAHLNQNALEGCTAESCDYSTFSRIHDTSIDYCNKALDFSQRGLKRLKEIDGNSIPQSLTNEIQLRIEQGTKQIQFYLTRKQLINDYYNYMIGGPDQNRAVLWDAYSKDINMFNKDLNSLNQVKEKIDSKWEQNWYPDP